MTKSVRTFSSPERMNLVNRRLILNQSQMNSEWGKLNPDLKCDEISGNEDEQLKSFLIAVNFAEKKAAVRQTLRITDNKIISSCHHCSGGRADRQSLLSVQRSFRPGQNTSNNSLWFSELCWTGTESVLHVVHKVVSIRRHKRLKVI